MSATSPVGNATPQGKQLLMSDIHAKWTKFSEPEIAALKSRDELVAQVQSKYAIDAVQAGSEVDSVLKGREF